MILEICANSLESAINAEKGGADRIELCVDLEVGGLTPPTELISEVKNKITIPVFVLIRPFKGSFVYKDTYLESMMHSIKICKEYGCEGIVAGALNLKQQIDIEGTSKLIEAAHPLPFTFHRAFDLVKDPEKSLQDLINLGVTRILSSGKHPTALEGIELLKNLKMQAANHLIIMPGGGVRSHNVAVFKEHGFSEIHSSAIPALSLNQKKDIEIQEESAYTMGSSNLKEIKAIKAVIES